MRRTTCSRYCAELGSASALRCSSTFRNAHHPLLAEPALNVLSLLLRAEQRLSQHLHLAGGGREAVDFCKRLEPLPRRQRELAFIESGGGLVHVGRRHILALPLRLRVKPRVGHDEPLRMPPVETVGQAKRALVARFEVERPRVRIVARAAQATVKRVAAFVAHNLEAVVPR